VVAAPRDRGARALGCVAAVRGGHGAAGDRPAVRRRRRDGDRAGTHADPPPLGRAGSAINGAPRRPATVARHRGAASPAWSTLQATARCAPARPPRRAGAAGGDRLGGGRERGRTGDPAHRARRRPGRRDPAREPHRGADARGRRAGPRPPAARARCPDPAMGSPYRCRGHVAPPRGSRRRTGQGPRALRRGTRLRERDARSGSGLGGMERDAQPWAASVDPRGGSADPPGRDRADGPVAGPGGRPARTADQRDRDQRSIRRAARSSERSPVPAHRRHRGGRRSGARRSRAAADRRAQGRPPRQRDRDHRGAAGRPPPGRRHRVRGNRQSVRAPGGVHARPAGRDPRTCDADRS